MRTLLIRVIYFVIMLACMFYTVQYLFRSLLPVVWVVALIGCVVILIKFPYEKFFNIKNKENEEK